SGLCRISPLLWIRVPCRPALVLLETSTSAVSFTSVYTGHSIGIVGIAPLHDVAFFPKIAVLVSSTHTQIRHAKNSMNPNIQVPFHRPSIGREEIDEVVRTLESGWLTTGPRTTKFEQE